LSRSNRSRKKANKQQPVQSSAARKLGDPRNLMIGLILGLTFLAFSNSILNDFAYDDTTQILQNLFIRDFRNLPKAMVTEAWYWRVQQDRDPNKQDKPSTPYYRPVFIVCLMVLWKLFGASAAGWHFFNLVLHLLAVYLVFLVMEKFTKDLRLSTIASFLFAIHPLRSESVAWVSGLTDPLLATFLLSSFYFYLRYRAEGAMKLMAAALALFLLATFTKEPAVALPLFICAYELVISNQDKPLRERIKPAVKYSACFLAVSAFYFSARYDALGFALNDNNFKSYPVDQVLMTIPLVIWKYLALLVWPVELSLFHGTYLVKSPLDVRFIAPFAALIALAFALWRLRRSIIARFGVLWFAVNLLPVLNLSAFAEDFLVQERYLYIPSIGFSLLVAIGIVRVPLEKWLPIGSRAASQTALVAVLVLLLGGKSVAQNAVWKDDMTLWSYGVEQASDQFMSRFILGHKFISLGEYRKAIEELEACLKLSPNNMITMSNLAAAHVIVFQSDAAVNPLTADRSHLDRAVELCEKGLTIRNDFPPLWDTLGQVYTFETGLKNYDRAIACFQRGLSLNPQNALINFHLGGTLAKKGDLENGMRLLRTAIEMDPNIFDAHKFLGYAYKAKGQLKEAIDELGVYLKLQPNAGDASRVGKDVQDLRAQLQALAGQP